ncbi:LPXTG-site transpeptidase (sortase) family protein [Cytobacillus purgationiresistens]|uniref:LPXTG-site transpeptidase (Sortase) family protein n=1 Tax=Cytobacillus purgationiresistens TaxID=863449 RepID=A0ABU0ALI3_9BACI|nr:LPXTG-site transpeptidase (sortase) family protein [Cytobacillus purgationiresistens]
MAGPVDSKEGPAVFFYLKQLKEGDEMIIKGKGEENYTFQMQKVESFPTDEAPIKEIFGSEDNRSLNLITCTGTFNRKTGNHEEMLIVNTVLNEEASFDNGERSLPESLQKLKFKAH